MPLKKPTIVLLDMDGTTVRHLDPRMLHVLERMDDTFYATRLFLAGLGTKLKIHPRLRLRPPRRRAQRPPRLIVHRALHKIRRKRVEQIVEPCPGILDLLSLLRAHDIPLALVSNGLGKGYGHEVLSTFGLDPYFSAAVFREDMKKSKPDPESLLTALSRLDRPISKNDVIWYIGDRKKDVRAALAATRQLPCPVVPIGYGLNAAMAIFETGLSTDNLVLSYEDWLEDVAGILGPLAPIRKTSLPLMTDKPSNTARTLAA